MTVNLRLDSSLARGLGVELHVCEVQLLLRALTAPLSVRVRVRVWEAGRQGGREAGRGREGGGGREGGREGGGGREGREGGEGGSKRHSF